MIGVHGALVLRLRIRVFDRLTPGADECLHLVAVCPDGAVGDLGSGHVHLVIELALNLNRDAMLPVLPVVRCLRLPDSNGRVTIEDDAVQVGDHVRLIGLTPRPLITA